MATDTNLNDQFDILPIWRQGLFYRYNNTCFLGGEDCRYLSPKTEQDYFPVNSASFEYYGRGAMNLEYSTTYGRFSRAKNPETWNGKMNYLNAPDRLSQDADLAYLSAFYRYMTPEYPNPSVHAVVTELW